MQKKTSYVRTTVRETPKEGKLSTKVAGILGKNEGHKVSKSKAYLHAMQAYAYRLGL